MKYYLFVIKKDIYKKNDFYLYNVLENLKKLNKENYNYGFNIYNNVCSFFNDKALKKYIDEKYEIRKENDIYYLKDKKSTIKIGKSSCCIKTTNYLRELLCLFYIYNKNIFVCNFATKEYFWLKDKIIANYM